VNLKNLEVVGQNEQLLEIEVKAATTLLEARVKVV
tara:strand:+ start:542 stop:646 length:105 start_codon:yes stop_codon:yes gene_type:complete